MVMTDQEYTVSEFAKLAAVTVRTLHHYDRIGLLKPSGYTQNGHRRYARRDLLRLQQIVTLKWMGFSLAEIQAVMSSERYDLHSALTLQKQAVDAKIAQLQTVSSALSKAADQAGDDLDADTVQAIINGLQAGDYANWLRDHFGEEALSIVQTRSKTIAPDVIEQGQRDWMTLIADFQACRHLPPESDDVQALAARMHTLISAFTGDDPAVREGVESVWQKPEDHPAEWHTPMHDDPDLLQFMNDAYRIYEERQ
jgi:DNA-binding transcriptional MerR regulator